MTTDTTDTTTTSDAITWGLAPRDPALPYWGARAIWEGGDSIDLLPDRQTVHGSLDERRALSRWINERALPALGALLDEMDLGPLDAGEVSVRGNGYRLRADPRESGGYLYLVAEPDPSAVRPLYVRAAPRPRRRR